MQLEKTAINDCFLITPKVFTDDRGYFMESFNTKAFQKATKLNVDFVQDNESFSAYGVIRGLHAQKGDYAQAKLVRVIKGEVLDVVIDFRKDSPTYLNQVIVKLNAEAKKQLFVPRGCLHGFSVLSKTAIFFYKCDNFYNQSAEIGYRYDDPFFKIDWQIPKSEQLISVKDAKLPLWNQ
ncbi:dTDP-4-dehydrorhamnose 3,5-epimerase [Mesonia maritima]|uniref:dTDP-4-dehydrorhamnose 3,5-epimerase n=1 Tax=Mesonia maritima TaxID=1793873 RepID=A0ABU1K858_9FLAO|nr:dTDP-4-dehydrorhamnose 3,5-epimerase [Mesonia maritima]MDR6301785.1 dTDP-4-dehydrorhamnose 3,5-epimerase [Mesonia maritima]